MIKAQRTTSGTAFTTLLIVAAPSGDVLSMLKGASDR